MVRDSIWKAAIRSIAVVGILASVACSKNDEAYRTAKKEAYDRAYWKAHRDAYDKAFPPAFAAASEEAYSGSRKELVEQGAYTYKAWWLTAIVLVFAALGFALQHRVSAHSRSCGLLRGDIDRLLLGEPAELGAWEQFDTARIDAPTHVVGGGHQQLRSGKEQA